MRSVAKIALSICICTLTGVVGSFATRDSVNTWYADLAKPFFAPPNWTFGVVWPILYAMMGLSVFMIWRRGTTERQVRIALGLFALQLALNGLWTPIFFGLRMIALALIEIVLLWMAILVTILAFWRVSKTAACLLLPYLAWVGFAIALNASFWHLNR
jgi:tryptophan-rich sensory protein